MFYKIKEKLCSALILHKLTLWLPPTLFFPTRKDFFLLNSMWEVWEAGGMASLAVASSLKGGERGIEKKNLEVFFSGFHKKFSVKYGGR